MLDGLNKIFEEYKFVSGSMGHVTDINITSYNPVSGRYSGIGDNIVHGFRIVRGNVDPDGSMDMYFSEKGKDYVYEGKITKNISGANIKFCNRCNLEKILFKGVRKLSK